MADAAHELLTVEDWLAFDDGPDARCELLDGVLVAMPPPSDRHGTISYGALPLTGSRSFRSRVLDAEIHLDGLYRNTEL